MSLSLSDFPPLKITQPLNPKIVFIPTICLSKNNKIKSCNLYNLKLFFIFFFFFFFFFLKFFNLSFKIFPFFFFFFLVPPPPLDLSSSYFFRQFFPLMKFFFFFLVSGQGRFWIIKKLNENNFAQLFLLRCLCLASKRSAFFPNNVLI